MQFAFQYYTNQVGTRMNYFVEFYVCKFRKVGGVFKNKKHTLDVVLFYLHDKFSLLVGSVLQANLRSLNLLFE